MIADRGALSQSGAWQDPGDFVSDLPLLRRALLRNDLNVADLAGRRNETCRKTLYSAIGVVAALALMVAPGVAHAQQPGAAEPPSAPKSMRRPLAGGGPRLSSLDLAQRRRPA
jgi:hypothetical protein